MLGRVWILFRPLFGTAHSQWGRVYRRPRRGFRLAFMYTSSHGLTNVFICLRHFTECLFSFSSIHPTMSSSPKYEPLRGSAPGSEATESEGRPFIDYETHSKRNRKQVRTIRALVALNIFLATLLCIVVFLWWQQQVADVERRPYCQYTRVFHGPVRRWLMWSRQMGETDFGI